MKQKIILLVALLSGIAAFVVSQHNIESFKISYESQFAKVRVVVAARSLVPGTVLKRDDIGTQEVIAKGIAGRAVKPDEFTEIVNKKMRTYVEKFQPILWSDLDIPYGGLGGMSAMVRPGERAIAIPVDTVGAVSGHVKPNDHVDILGTFNFPMAKAGGPAVAGPSDTVTLTILQDVTILATGRNLSRRQLESEGGADRFSGEQYSAVTVGVTPREAEVLVFSHQKGKLTLTLRNREDVSVEQKLENVDFKKLEDNFNKMNQERQERLHPGSGAK